MYTIIQGDSLIKLKDLPENSVDSIVTDPPYELGFMGKSWDSTGIANNVDLWRECLRVLKPGGHLLAFSGTRTYHRMASAIEDAGFEVRDMIEWVYGSGFPKSLNIGKAVDKLQGNEREVVGKGNPMSSLGTMHDDNWVSDSEYNETKGNSAWEGWGTALKPAHEPICMARKPLGEKTVAENCLKWGTGGINIDESRVENTGKSTLRPLGKSAYQKGGGIVNGGVAGTHEVESEFGGGHDGGRFPANLIHDNSEEVRECFPEAKGCSHISKGTGNNIPSKNVGLGGGQINCTYGDNGSASRFFKSIIYQAKASKSERNKGCEELETKDAGASMNSRCASCGKQKLDHEVSRCKCDVHIPAEMKSREGVKNNHPTVKPIALMEYLIKMVTPKGGTVLDPFAGSFSTGVACTKNGFDFIGIEMEEEYVKIGQARLAEAEKDIQPTLL